MPDRLPRNPRQPRRAAPPCPVPFTADATPPHIALIPLVRLLARVAAQRSTRGPLPTMEADHDR